MSIRDYLETEPLYDVTVYSNYTDLPREAVPFTGSPRKHPYDHTKVMIIQDPFTSKTCFYEFPASNILYVEERPNLVTDTGTNINMATFWVKKGTIGVKHEPFEVETPLKTLKDSEILLQVLSEIE